MSHSAHYKTRSNNYRNKAFRKIGHYHCTVTNCKGFVTVAYNYSSVIESDLSNSSIFYLSNDQNEIEVANSVNILLSAVTL